MLTLGPPADFKSAAPPGKHVQFALVALSIIALLPHQAGAAGFDCKTTKAAVERQICKSAELSDLDDALRAAYKAALTHGMDAKRVRERQRAWLKLRDGCLSNTSVCSDVADLYRERIEELKQVAALQGRVLPPQRAYLYPVLFDSVGPLKIGMSFDRLEFFATTRVTADSRAVSDISTDSCADVTFFLRDAPADIPEMDGVFHWSALGAQVRSGFVRRIDVMYDTQVHTREGIHLGSTEEDVKRAYGSALQAGKWSAFSAHTALTIEAGREGGGHAFLVKSPDGSLAMLIETDGVQVNAIHVGITEDFWSSDGEIYAATCETIEASNMILNVTRLADNKPIPQTGGQ
jgi:uncharacterized protein